jgi:hypothetical protein
VIDGLEPEIDLACKVAVLTAAGHGKAEIARRVGATGATFRRGFELAQHAAGQLDAGD